MSKITFYRLSKNNENYPHAKWDDKAMSSEEIICPVSDGHQRAGKRLTSLTIKLPTSKIGDFVWTWYGELIITERVKVLFQGAGFSGYELKPVKVSKVYKYHKEKDIISINDRAHGTEKIIQDRSPKAIPDLWELNATGWAGMAPSKSGIKFLESESCKDCGFLVYSDFRNPSKLIDISQWDGSDFFMIWPLPGFIFVTEKVADFIKKNKLRGCELIPVEKLPTGNNLLGELSPGRLSYWMPEKKAHLNGDPLNIF